MTSGSMRLVLFGVVCAGVGALAAVLLSTSVRDRVAGDPVKSAQQAETAAPRSNEESTSPPTRRAGARRQVADSPSQAPMLEQLQALGYVAGTYDPQSERSDVLVHVEGATHDGYNFYSSRKATGARLIDMGGRSIHEWQTAQVGGWQHAELLPNGDVIVIVKNERLSRYDKDSKLLWSVAGRFHHDLWIHDDEIYVLSRIAREYVDLHADIPVLEDRISVISMDGELKREVSILETLQNSSYAFLLPSISHMKAKSKNPTQLDLLHTNHVEVFDGRPAHRHPIYARNNILISMRNINAIAILDGETHEILWIWGPSNLTFQHHPTLLDNGNILLFDNGATQSRILEINPVSNEFVWSYGPVDGFFSRRRGGNQRLANGNTLITESDTGYAFEVTPTGETVWEFANPVVNRKKERQAIWRMTRVDPETLTFLD
jgi:outer membrane protein assembly factor BamB